MLLILTGWLFFRPFSIALQAFLISCIIVEITSTASNMKQQSFSMQIKEKGWERLGGRKTIDSLGTTPIPRVFLGTWIWL